MVKYDNVSCSQCGRDFGPGDHGFSHCNHHRKIAVRPSRQQDIYAELLAALKAFVAEVDGTYPFESLPGARAAIAKAEDTPPLPSVERIGVR